MAKKNRAEKLKTSAIPEKVSKAEAALDSEEKQTISNSENLEPNQDIKDEDDDKPIIIPKIKQLLSLYLKHKRLTIPISVVLVLGLIFGIPNSRYSVLGTVVKKDFPVVVRDSVTNLPVSDVDLNIRGHAATTDGEGRAVVSGVPVGFAELVASKNYYNDKNQRVAIGLSAPKGHFEVTIEANGRQVPVQAINKITGERLGGVDVKAGDTSAKTDSNGEAVIVLPPDQHEVTATVSADGFNSIETTISVSQLFIEDNKFQLVPAGKVYFLSKRTGKINVMKSDLDGSNQEVVIKGTGSEDDDNTRLLATRDWKFLVLQAKREGKQERLFLIDTSMDKLTEIDGSNDAYVELVGWADHNLIYKVSRQKVQYWKAKNQALKVFNADSQEIAVVDENRADNTGDEYDSDYESIGSVHVVGDKIVYNKTWTINSYDENLDGKKSTLYETGIDGTGMRVVKEFPQNSDNYYTWIDTILVNPNQLNISYYQDNYDENYDNDYTYYTYENGEVRDNQSLENEEFWGNYPTFLKSPNGNQTFWFESRDGNSTLFVGNDNGQNGKKIAENVQYQPYGWFGDDYLLVSKDGNELYIMPVDGTGTLGQVLKITNYHKISYQFWNYGGGYGGI